MIAGFFFLFLFLIATSIGAIILLSFDPDRPPQQPDSNAQIVARTIDTNTIETVAIDGTLQRWQRVQSS